MNYGELVALADSYINKKNLTNRIGSFVNQAKLNLQRKHDFAFTRTEADMSYPSAANTGVALPSNFKTFHGQYAVWVVTGTLRVPCEASSEQHERARLFDTVHTQLDSDGVLSSQASVTSESVRPIRYYVKPGMITATLLTVPEQINHTLRVYYYAWLSDYVADIEEDYLLKFGHDMLLWSTLKIANMFLHDEAKVPIDKAMADEAMDNFTKLDNELERSRAPIEVI